MPSNVEIKARLTDFARTRRLAEALSGNRGESFTQDDTFFQVPQGRLKLRILGEGHAELIYYQREKTLDPKESHYITAPVPFPDPLLKLLSSALGVAGKVHKIRTLFLIGQTRVHLDDVAGVGKFVELEVVLKEGQPVSDGMEIAEELMRRLEIRREDLVAAAYLDL
jgi:predicted adenylyl cyclase CyaB